MNREEERNYVFAQLSSLPNAFQYVSVTNYIENLEQENKRLKEIENKLNFIKNRVKQGMSQENINKCAIELVNSYLKEVE